MGVMDWISLGIVLLLALYGLSKLVEAVSVRLLAPRRLQLSLQLSLCGAEQAAEQHLRHAQYLSAKWHVPLVVEDIDLTEDARHIVLLLIQNGVGELISKKDGKAACTIG